MTTCDQRYPGRRALPPNLPRRRREGSSRLGPRDVVVDVPGEHVHRYVAALDHRIVERAQVVFLTERRLRPVAQAVDGRVADLVAARLAGPTAIAIDFGRDLQRVRAVALDKEIDALLARPALGVKPGIDHQPAGAE